jgi:hypothetical protein
MNLRSPVDPRHNALSHSRTTFVDREDLPEAGAGAGRSLQGARSAWPYRQSQRRAAGSCRTPIGPRRASIISSDPAATGPAPASDDAHDTLSIVRQYHGGAGRTISIPGPAGVSDAIITAYHGRLLLQSNLGPGGPSSLFWFNPATRSIRFISRAPHGSYGVAGAIAYGYWNG